MLEAREIHKSYGELKALAGVDLDLGRGQVLGLLGANGAGKSTLISIIAGLKKPDAGTVRVGGIDVREDPLEAQRSMGLAPQDVGVYLQLSTRANLQFFGRLAGLAGGRLLSRIEAVSEALGLEALLDRKASELSGGEKRRLHTAIALLAEPQLLLLDEPTAGVDVSTRSRLLDVVRSLARDGAAICYTTHYLHELETLADTVVILDRGTVIASGSPQELVLASGDAVLEIRLDGTLPHELGVQTVDDHGDSVLKISADDPGRELTTALAKLGGAVSRIKSIEIAKPSLESFYLGVTGRHYDATAATSPIDDD